MRIGYYFGVSRIAAVNHIEFLSWKSGITRSIIERLIENENIPIFPEVINLKRLNRECEKLGVKLIKLEKYSKFDIKHKILSLIKFGIDLKILLRIILIENHPIIGFSISKVKYTANIESRFVSLGLDEFQMETGIYPDDNYSNQYLLKYKVDSNKTLYLCKEKTLNPINFRLVLKTHKENFVRGLCILSPAQLEILKDVDVDPLIAFDMLLKNYEKKTGSKYINFNGIISNKRVEIKSDPILYFINIINIPIFKDGSGKISLIPKGYGDFDSLVYFKKMTYLTRNFGIVFESEDYNNWLRYIDYYGETDVIKYLERNQNG